MLPPASIATKIAVQTVALEPPIEIVQLASATPFQMERVLPHALILHIQMRSMFVAVAVLSAPLVVLVPIPISVVVLALL
jgi:hypothetical protein